MKGFSFCFSRRTKPSSHGKYRENEFFNYCIHCHIVTECPPFKKVYLTGFLEMRSAYSIFCVLLLLNNPVQATVYEFGANGSVTIHEAKDYLSNNRRKQAPRTSKLNLTSSKKFDLLVQKAAKKYKVSPILVHAVIQNESSYDPNAISPKGAMGLMQLMPATAKHYLVKDAFDPEQNILGGTRYLSELLNRYENNIALSLAAYNAGETAVDKYNGIPPYPETEQYVSRILRVIE